MVIELWVVQFWSEIILVILREFDFEITHMISDQTALHSVQLPLFIEQLVDDILVDIEIMLIKFKNKMLSIVAFSQVLLEHRNTQGLGKIKFINIIQT